MLPSKVVVAGIEYEIKEVDGLVEEHDLGGQILYQKGLIKIDSGMCKDKKEQILVHEILHSIFREAGYNEQNEDMVNRLGIVLYQVLKDNPGLLSIHEKKLSGTNYTNSNFKKESYTVE